MAIDGLLPYPTTAPTAAVFKYLVDAFRGSAPVDKAEANHVAWHVWGYLSNKFAPHGPLLMQAASAELTDASVEAALQAAVAHADNGVVVAASPAEASPAWVGILINIAIRLAERYLGR